MERAHTFFRRHAVVIALVALGIALRLSMLRSFNPMWSYDAQAHLDLVNWYRTHAGLPPRELMLESFHPPLYYFVAGWLVRHRASPLGLQAFGVALGCARLILFAIVAARWLGGRRLALYAAVALAAVLPASIMADGMLGAEPLLDFFSLIVIALVSPVFEGQGRRRFWAAAGMGLALGLALLTKVSAALLLASICAGGLALAWDGAPSDRARRLAPLMLALAACAAVSGGYIADNARTTGKPFLTSFDAYHRGLVARFANVAPLDRRPLAFVLGWRARIHRRPVEPTATGRFWPALIAGTYVDYYNYGYRPRVDKAETTSNYLPLQSSTLRAAVVSFHGGLVITLATALAWLAAVVFALRARRAAWLALLAAPLFALTGALYFAIAYPFDNYGIIKAAHLQYAAAPLFVLFGLAVDFTWRRPRLRALAVISLSAVALVAAYTLLCRLA